MPCGAAKDANHTEKAAENGHCGFEDLDHSVLQQPLNLGVTNVKQILKCIQSGSREIKDIILNECNIIYECKACVGLFRSLANFMYHKRCYCKKHLCEEMVLFENFDENSQTVIVQPEPPNENLNKTQEKTTTPKLLECTVDLVKADIGKQVKSVSNSETNAAQISQSEAPTVIVAKGRGRPSDAKKVSEAEKNENLMVSRRTREKNAQKTFTLDMSKGLKAETTDEPAEKCLKIDLSEKEVNKSEAPNDVRLNSDKNELVKFSNVVEKAIPSGPKIIFKPIEGNPNAVFQNNEKAQSENANVKVDTSAVKTKLNNEKLIIVLKKDVKATPNPVIESVINDNEVKSSGKQTEFHLTRRKRLMNRTDCNVQQLKCLTCKTQFVSLKTLYYHMMSFHSKKRLYYPCPFCKTLFVQMYGVTRHLVSIHNKTKEQINKLRDVIKKKGVWKKVDDVNPYNESIQCPKKAENYEMKQESNEENKADGIDRNSTECSPIKTIIKLGKNVTLYKCTKCNRLFGRKSSQVSHEKFCIMNAIKVETVDLTSPTKKPSSDNFFPASPKQSCPEQKFTSTQSSKEMPSGTKVSTRPKRGAEKQMHKDFVNSQTLKWRSANKLETSSKSLPQPSKKSSVKSLEKKVMSIMNAENLLCLKCNKKFSSYSNLRRHVAIHVGWTRFKCKHCDYQAYNKSQCWAHVQKAHSVPDADMDKSIVNLTNSNTSSKKCLNQVAQTHKCSPELSVKSSPTKGNAIPKVKITKKKSTGPNCVKNVSDKKHIVKKEPIEIKKEIAEKKEINDVKKDKTPNVPQIHKYAITEYKKETNYKSVTTSNPTTIILSKKIPSSTVQSIVTISAEPVSSTSPNKISSIRSSPRKNEGKVPEEKPTTPSFVTRSATYTKGSPIQIKLPVRPNSIEDIKRDSVEKAYSKKDKLISEWFPKKDLTKKERLISEWFPKKDLNSNTNRRDSAPLIIGLVPASSSGLNAKTKNSGIAFDGNNA